MTRKPSGQNFTTFDTKTYRSGKPTQDELVLHLNLPYIIFDCFIVVSHPYDSKMFGQNVMNFGMQTLQACKPTQNDLVCPKTSKHHFLGRFVIV